MRPGADEAPILVIDDDVDTRAALVELLDDAGYDVITARNGLEALTIMRHGFIPRAMLVDIHMPLMDGEAFCRDCDAEPLLAAIPRIIISANPDAESRMAAFRARTLLKKPIRPDELFGGLFSVRAMPPKRAAARPTEGDD